MLRYNFIASSCKNHFVSSFKIQIAMAENNLLQGGSNSRSSNPDWDDNQNRFGRENESSQQPTNYGTSSSGVSRESDFEQSPGNLGYSNTGNDYNRGNDGNFGSSYGNQDYRRHGRDYFSQSNYGNRSYGEGYDNDYNQGNRSSNYNRGYGQGNFGQAGYGSGSYNPGGYSASSNSPFGSQYGSYESDYNQNRRFNPQSHLGNAGSGYGSDYNRGEYGRYSEGYGFNSPQYDTRSSYNSGYEPERSRMHSGYRSEYNPGNRYEGRNWWDRAADEASSWFRDEDEDRRRRMSGRGNYGSYGRQRSDNRNTGRDNDRDWWDRTRDEVSAWFGDEDAERRREKDRQNDNRGRGPRGYQRSDERIKEDINDRLSDDSFVDASDVDVDVTSGEVILTGSVDNRMAKRRAEDLAEAISGVRNVENRIRVRQQNYSDNPRTSNASWNSTTGSTGGTGTAGNTTGSASSSADRNIGSSSDSRTKK
jgi:osmotically-inducible protein OsmY